MTYRDLLELFQANGFEFERRAILLPGPIRNVGTHTFTVRVHTDVRVELSIKVIGELDAEQAAKAQLRHLRIPEAVGLQHARKGPLARQEQQALDRIDKAEAAIAEAGAGRQRQQRRARAQPAADLAEKRPAPGRTLERRYAIRKGENIGHLMSPRRSHPCYQPLVFNHLF